ncbi:Protein of unknown function [Gryllus bimaculatus]|nr:Protein of unknown function [Gryllus bimaculatus]
MKARIFIRMSIYVNVCSAHHSQAFNSFTQAKRPAAAAAGHHRSSDAGREGEAQAAPPDRGRGVELAREEAAARPRRLARRRRNDCPSLSFVPDRSPAPSLGRCARRGRRGGSGGGGGGGVGGATRAGGGAWDDRFRNDPVLSIVAATLKPIVTNWE